MRGKYFEVRASADGNSADIYLFGEIVSDGQQWENSDMSAVDFKNALKDLGDVSLINLHINSPGGSVFDGIAIENMLKRHKATVNVYIDGLAASIASVIAMGGDKIIMPENAMMMIHNAASGIYGNAKELRDWAGTLDRVTDSIKTVYLSRAKSLDEATLTKMMDAETWLSAQEAVDLGLADEIEDAKNYAASLRGRLFNAYKHVPEDLPLRAKQSVPTQDNEDVKRLKAKLELELAI